jgi:hypothetical protein
MSTVNRKIRERTTVGWTKIVPRSLGRAYFNVVLGFALLAFLIWGIAYAGGTFDSRTVVQYVLGFLVVIAFIPRSVHGLVILRREARR